MKETKRNYIVGFLVAVMAVLAVPYVKAEAKTVTLRVCNWEEYIDEGGWDEDEAIDLGGQRVFGENSLVQDF